MRFTLLRRGRKEAVYALFLPNLIELQLWWLEDDICTILDRLPSVVDQVRGGTKLELLFLLHYETQGGFNLGKGTALFTLPSLRRLGLSDMDDDGIILGQYGLTIRFFVSLISESRKIDYRY